MLAKSLNIACCAIYSAKPGKVVGPVYDNGNTAKETYDPRSLARNTVLPPQVAPPAYCYRRGGNGKLERSAPGETTERDLSSQTKQVLGMAAAKLAPDIAINIDTNPFYMTRAGVTKMDRADPVDSNLLQGKAHQYGGIGAAAAAASTAAHRKVGAVQFSMSRMY